MRVRIALIGFVCMMLSLAATTAQASIYVETFSANADSWKYGYNVNFSTVLPATWVATGGNPDGHISGVSSNLYAVWTFDTSPYGDITGLTMTIDTMVTDGETGTAQIYVGRNNTYYIDGTWAIGNDHNWTTHTALLDSSHFTHWTQGGAGNASLAYVLAAPDDIGIFFGGGLVGGTGNVLVDNFGTVATVPEPATILVWSLLGAASWLGMGVWRRGQHGGRRSWSEENRMAIHDIIARGGRN